MKATLTIILLLISLISSAQEVELFQITPKWSIGDERHVHTETKSTTYVNDAVYSEVDVVADYTIAVIGIEDHYTLSYTQESGDLEVDANFGNDSVTNIIMDLIKKVENRAAHLEFIVSVDKETGGAYEIQNSEEINATMKTIILELVTDIGKSNDLSSEKIESLPSLLQPIIDSLIPQMNQTILNSINYLFQAYSYSFPLNSTYEQDMMAHDINAMGVFGTTEFPAILTLNSQEDGNQIQISTSTAYDKSFLLAQMKNNSEYIEDITEDDLLILESDQVVIDLNSTWILEHLSTVRFQMPGVKVIENSLMRFE
jgi:hypothetical protein